MSHVDGAVVVLRPDLTNSSGKLAPAGSLDYAKTLQSYFSMFKTSLLPRYDCVGSVERSRPSVDPSLHNKHILAVLRRQALNSLPDVQNLSPTPV